MRHYPIVCSGLTSCSIQAAARILTTRLGLIRTSSRYRDPNTTWRATQTHSVQRLGSVRKLLNTHQLLPAVTEAFSHPRCRCSDPGSPGWFLTCWTPSRIRRTYWRSTLTAACTGPREKRGVRIIIHRKLIELIRDCSVQYGGSTRKTFCHLSCLLYTRPTCNAILLTPANFLDDLSVVICITSGTQGHNLRLSGVVWP